MESSNNGKVFREEKTQKEVKGRGEGPVTWRWSRVGGALSTVKGLGI